MSNAKESFLSGEVEDDDEEDDIVDVEGSVKESTSVETKPAPSANGGNSLVRPVADVDEVAQVYEDFEKIKEGLLKSSDVQEIGKGRNKSAFIKKSGWRKIATAFNVSVDITRKEKSVENGVITWRVEARATAPNGRSNTAWSACSSNESNHMEYIGKGNMEKEAAQEKAGEDATVLKVDGKWRRLKTPQEVQEHDILTTCETRAKNRAISDLVGGGSVSAEEVTKESVLE